MREDQLRPILRIVAVIAILIGVVQASQALVGMRGVSSLASGSFGQVQIGGSSVGAYLIVAQLMPAVWGVVLYFVSGKIARIILD